MKRKKTCLYMFMAITTAITTECFYIYIYHTWLELFNLLTQEELLPSYVNNKHILFFLSILALGHWVLGKSMLLNVNIFSMKQHISSILKISTLEKMTNIDIVTYSTYCIWKQIPADKCEQWRLSEIWEIFCLNKFWMKINSQYLLKCCTW